MLSRLAHGALLGAVVLLLCGFLEAMVLLCLHPFHLDFGLFSRILPLLLPVGITIGLGSALILPFTSGSGERKRLPGFLLLISCLAWCLAEICAQQTSLPSLFLVPLLAFGLQQLLRPLGKVSLSWMLDGLVRPLPLLALGGLLLGLAGIGRLLPDLPRNAPQGAARQTDRPEQIIFIVRGLPGSRLGALGNPRNTSPILDQLAREGKVTSQSLSFSDAMQAARNAASEGARTAFFGLSAVPVSEEIAAAHGWAWDFSQPSLRKQLRTTQMVEGSVVASLLGNSPFATTSVQKHIPAEEALQHVLRWLNQNSKQDRTTHLICRIDLALSVPWQDLPVAEQERFLPDGANATPEVLRLAALDARIRRLDSAIGSWIQALRDRERLETTNLWISGDQEGDGFLIERNAKRLPRREK